MAAVQSSDIHFLVLLAGTGIPGNELLLMQQELILQANGETAENIAEYLRIQKKVLEIVMDSDDQDGLEKEIVAYLKTELEASPEEIPAGMTAEKMAKSEAAAYTSKWMQYFIKYDPAVTMEKVKCPVMALNGEKDLQVPPKQNLGPIEEALKKSGNKNYVIREYPGLNHLFQTCETGSPSEYGVIEETFSPLVLKDMAEWILRR